MGTPIHGEVDPTVKKKTCLSKHYAHTTERASIRNESPIVLAGFMQQPTSDAHSSTYLTSAKFDGISYTAYIHMILNKCHCLQYTCNIYIYMSVYLSLSPRAEIRDSLRPEPQ